MPEIWYPCTLHHIDGQNLPLAFLMVLLALRIETGPEEASVGDVPMLVSQPDNSINTPTDAVAAITRRNQALHQPEIIGHPRR
ncbi:MAG: hypothetical protein KGQ37_12940 [Hyphomicrobiales bacterium]|nr:hypothetical protein [Hyphomicrobiales bacterium]